MASLQHFRDEALDSEDKATRDQTREELKSIEKRHIRDGKMIEQTTVGGSVMNHAKDPWLKFHDKHEWHGHFIVDYPKALKQGLPGVFVHANGSSKAALVYASSAVDAAHGGCAWLVAWSVTSHGPKDTPTRNQIYVEAGAMDKYSKIDWKEIERKVDASNNTSYYRDKITGAEASAAISDGCTVALAVACSFKPHATN